MTQANIDLRGIWLPLITPFRDGDLDERSLRRLAAHYLDEPLDGFILAATTGEGLTLEETELRRVVDIVGEVAGGRLPVCLGLSGSDTRKMAKTVAATAGWPVEGYLVTCPYYSRPSQEGLYRHFEAVAAATDRPVLIYNIPYRTGVNMSNDTLLSLAEIPNIRGLKDCCADMAQTFDLLVRRPDGFRVMTGEDALFYGAIVHGADGGILASAHVETAAFAAVRNRLLAGDQPGALQAWQAVAAIPRLLFEVPSPAPIKHWLWRQGLIDSPEVRLPITGVNAGLAARLDAEMARRG
ncbi:MAG TPA: 4-hydroxy-tetrahydrodipicolinate synthase [Alphaproteobacteria bacterium]|jgi:4-hydroxy-tetrahydrodipicolinate synthase|nr:4-hydroxy-tetrahydrodipicolinate synthase [Alphaproteobacteria bacterium]